MKVVHYIETIDRSLGGLPSYMRLLTMELGKLAEVHVVAPRTDNPLPLEHCTVHYIGRYRPMCKAWKREVTDILEQVKPDIVNMNLSWLPDCAAVQRIAQSKGYKVVTTLHGMLDPWKMKRHHWTRKLPALWLYEKVAIRKADCLIATSEQEMTNVAQLGFNDRLRLVEIGIDVEAVPMKKSWKRTKRILFLSRVNVVKGVDTLVEAAARLHDELQGWQIDIVGDGEDNYVDFIRTLIHTNGLDDIVTLKGGAYGDDRWEYFRKSDFFVLPTHSENFCIAIAEALATATPVITTTGAPWHDIETYQAGAWIENDTEQLVETMRRFLSLSEEELERMGRNGRQLIETKYSAPVMARKMMDIYENVLNGR